MPVDSDYFLSRLIAREVKIARREAIDDMELREAYSEAWGHHVHACGGV